MNDDEEWRAPIVASLEIISEADGPLGAVVLVESLALDLKRAVSWPPTSGGFVRELIGLFARYADYISKRDLLADCKEVLLTTAKQAFGVAKRTEFIDRVRDSVKLMQRRDVECRDAVMGRLPKSVVFGLILAAGQDVEGNATNQPTSETYARAY